VVALRASLSRTSFTTLVVTEGSPVLIVRIVAVVVLILGAVVAVLRWRKLRRDAKRDAARQLMHIMPASPYEPAKGFRVLGKGEGVTVRTPDRPRIENGVTRVFSDMASSEEPIAVGRQRHNEDWALERALSSRSMPISFRGVAITVVALIFIVGVVGLAYNYRHHHAVATTTTTTQAVTTTTVAPSTTTTLPSKYTLTSTSKNTAVYSVSANAANKYKVEVMATKGNTWAVFQMGSAKTLEWQGNVSAGKSVTYEMTGPSIITLGSPADAKVFVDGVVVVFPTPLPPTLIVSLSPTAN
jgi:hypothetical protein